MKTLVLPARYTADSISLAGAAVESGWQVERLQTWRPPPQLAREEVGAIYGEPLFGAVVASELALVLLEPSLDWLAGLPHDYLLRRVQFTSLAEAKKRTDSVFVKPADDKCFPAAVYESGAALPAGDLLEDTAPVLISDPVSWTIEFRFFVRERGIATFSPSLKHGKLIEHETVSDADQNEALSFCSRMLLDATIPLPPAVALDVGHIEHRGWAVVEANAAWASGIYGCEAVDVLRVIERACIRPEHARAEDRNWVVDRKT